MKERKKIEVIEKISFRAKEKTGKIVQRKETPVALKKSKMKWKSSAYLGIKSLAVKPLRLILTVLISALAFAVFGLFDTIANLSVEKILKNHLQQSSSSTLVVNADYVVDYTASDKYSVKLSQGAINGLSQGTGGVVKGIFDLRDNVSGSITHTQRIEDIANSKVVVGRKYYANTVNGFIEFDRETELNADGTFKDFSYRVVEGRYPALVYEEDKLVESSLNQVAISTYLADSIIFYLNDHVYNGQLNGRPAQSYSDLLSAKINVGQEEYTIVGIVDCGTIPQKYDALRQTVPSDINQSALSDDYAAYIGASARRCLFVAGGFLQEYNALNGSENVYYIGGADCTLSIKGKSGGKWIESYVYNAEEYTLQNVLFFSGKYNGEGAFALGQDEVLLDCQNLENLLNDEIYDLPDGTKQVEARELVRSLRTGTLAENRQTLSKLLAILELDWSNGLQVTVRHYSTATAREIEQEWRIVGVYFGVDDPNSTSPTRYKLMVGDAFMQTYHIYNQQGDYNKVLFSKKSVDKGLSAIVGYLTSQSGLTFSWYNNSVLSIISQNEAMIRQVADLFLYVALALALVSVFMLYNYISTSISSKRRSVGVLRGLGAGGKDILRIFLTESLVLAAINGVLACGLSALGCLLVNSYIMNTMNIFVAFALFGGRQILIIYFVSLLTAFLSSALPIFKISKKKPVELIR